MTRDAEAETRFRAMADYSPVLLWMSGVDGECTFFNQRWLEFTGRPMEAELGIGWADGVHFEDFQRCMDVYLTSFVSRQPFRMEYRLRRADGQYRWILDTGVPRYEPDGSFGGFIGSCIDITEIREARDAQARANEELERRVRERTTEIAHRLKERDVLLREVHHRVKNNLQLVSSLLSLQGRQIDDPRVLMTLDECKGRIRTIAMIHERLYRSPDLARIPFAEYTRGLADAIREAVGASPNVRLELDLQSLELAVDRAIPCGLILNELITNALKHAFPSRAGVIRVELASAAANRVTLTVRDDGVGLPADVDVTRTATLGFQLVCTLAEQLEAILTVDRQGGSAFRLDFPVAP